MATMKNMGRRALRKLDPTLDLTGICFDLDSISKPFDDLPVFGRRAPLEIEVGSGKGLFLQTAAENHPERNFLGLEIAKKYARFCAARIARRSLSNAKMICGEAVRFFHEWLPDQSAAAVHVYFPDPWWKKRHKKRRVMNESFIRQIERVLQPAGRLHFWSDVLEYYESTLQLVASVSTLHGPAVEEEREATHNLDFRTHFERRFRLGSQAIYRAVYVRPLDN